MAINEGDIEFAKYILSMAIHTGNPLSVQDCVLLKSFIEALLEHRTRPTENVRSREWRAGVYRKLLQDPEALEQFTLQAIQKFGIEDLSRMVVPEIQEKIVEDHVREMSTDDLLSLLKRQNRLVDVLDHVIARDPDFVRNLFSDQGYEDDQDEVVEDYDSTEEEGWNTND